MVRQHIIVILIRRLIMFSFIFWLQSFTIYFQVMISIIFVSILGNFYKASKAVSARHNFA